MTDGRPLLARWRVPLGFVTALVAIIYSSPTWRTVWIGFAVAVAGEAVRVWAAGHLEKSREVTRSGPYRFTRHPLYLGSSLIAVGVMLAANSLVVAIIGTLYMVATIGTAIRTEERFLRHIFVRDQMHEWTKDPLIMARADGMHYWDVRGKRYLDALSGIYVTSIGHNNKRVIAKIKHQLDTLHFSPPMHGTNPVAVRLANLLAELAPGDQITVDGVVVESQSLEVDESLLTGESDAVHKEADDEVLSGSFVAVGSGYMQATAVGVDSYAYKLAAEARKFSLVDSELRNGVDKILRVVQYLLVPTGVLLVWSQLATGEGFTEAVQGSVAGLGAMIPEGLVLLTSLAFAVGVIRCRSDRADP